jgi:hypothetical protein
MVQYVSYLKTSRKPVTQLREALHNILLEFGIPKKLVKLIEMCLNETCSKINVSKHSIWYISYSEGLKLVDALSLLLFSFALEYAIR